MRAWRKDAPIVPQGRSTAVHRRESSDLTQPDSSSLCFAYMYCTVCVTVRVGSLCFAYVRYAWRSHVRMVHFA